MVTDIVTVPRAATTPSNLLQRLLCAGSAKLEAGQPDEMTDDARLGRLFHRYWTNPNYNRAFLSDAERDLLALADRLLRDVLNTLGFETDHVLHVEQTFNTKDGRLPGKPDLVFVWLSRKAALVVDLKSGFAVVEGAELNMQLRGYAVLVSENFDLADIYVAILQPRLWPPSERITMAHYTAPDIARARKQIDSILAATERDDAPLVPGEDQCRFCRAKLICPPFRQAIGLPVERFKSEKELSKAAREAYIEARVKGCNDEQLEQVLEACALGQMVGAPARAEARDRIRAGRFTKFVLGKPSKVRTISKVRRAIAKLALAGIAAREQLLDMCDLSLDPLETDYRARHKGMTWQQARDKINKVIADCITTEEREPRILRK